MKNKQAVFFDRDNTIIFDVPYSGDPSKVELVPHIKDALTLLQENGFELFIISNQSGVGRGLITEEQVHAVNDKVQSLLGIQLTAIYNCFDAPDNPVQKCRKPFPKMILQACKDYPINPKKSFMVGDKKSDILAGISAGCKTALYSLKSKQSDINDVENIVDFISDDILTIANWMCRQKIE